MESIEGEGSKELLQAQAQVWNHIFTFINSMSLKCAVELGIPDIIHKHGKPITLSELRTQLSIPSAKKPCLRRLMDLLVHSGFLARQRSNGDDDVYLSTTFSRLFVKEEDQCMSPLLLLVLSPTLVSPWHSLSAWLKVSEPTTPFELAHGKSFWDKTNQVPEFNDLFNNGMACDAHFVAKVVIKECGEVFEGLRSLVDIGGGTGTMATAIAEAFPQVKCTVFDRPRVVEPLQGSSNIDVVGGDMFEYIPPAQAVLLKWILHDWSDEDCVKILKLCKAAIPSKEEGGKVIIIDMIVNHDSESPKLTETQLLFDMLMMVQCTGKERYEHEWRKIFTDAGFTNYKIIPLGIRSIIEVYP